MIVQREYLSAFEVAGDEWVYLNPSAAFLQLAIAALCLGALATVVTLRIFAPDQPLRLMGPLLVSLVALMGQALVLLGSRRAAFVVLAIGSWLVVTVTAVFTGGVHAPIIVAFPPIVMLVGWILRPCAVLIVSVLTVGATFGLVMADARGFLPSSPPVVTALHGVVQAVVVVLSGLLVVLLGRSYKK